MGKEQTSVFFRSSRTRELVRRLIKSGKTVAAAESCTAGLAAGLIAEIPGASRILWGSFVSYTPEAKCKMLGVKETTLKQYGTVSRETAVEMAMGALEQSGADYAFSVTGVAGPGNDESGIPAGVVWIAVIQKGGHAEAMLFRLHGSRNAIRRAAAAKALDILLKKLPKTNGEG